MAILIAGLIIFFGAHLVRVYASGFRQAQIAANPGRWRGLYSLVSLIGFGLLVYGYILARPDSPQLYIPPAWGRHVTLGLVCLGLIAIVAAYQPPGCIRIFLRNNPFLFGVALWAVGHLLANGDLVGVIVFGSFLVYAIVDMVAVSRRGEPMPKFAGYRGDWIAIVVGLVIYFVLVFWLHRVLFGVSPLG